MPKIKQSVELVEHDQNGVVTHDLKNQTISYGVEPNYIKLYLQDVLYLTDMPGRYSGLLMALLKRVSYAGSEDGLCVPLLPRTKRIICQELGWKGVQTLDNALRALVKGDILFRVDRGLYRLNPYLFGRGEWQDISRLRMTINYSEMEGRTFQAVIERKEELEAAAKAERAANEARQAAREAAEADQATDEPLPGQIDFEAVAAAQEATAAGTTRRKNPRRKAG